MSREGQRGVRSRERGGRGRQDQTFSVACTTAVEKRKDVNVLTSTLPQQSYD